MEEVMPADAFITTNKNSRSIIIDLILQRGK
jgi:hypothetical protein